MFTLKPYQKEAVSQLLSDFNNFFEGNSKKNTLILKAPTGSGKTVMATSFINEIIKTRKEQICFIWLSIGKGELHVQSKKKIKGYLDNYSKIYISDENFCSTHTSLSNQDILVVNWEKIWAKDKSGVFKNKIMRPSEKNSLPSILQNTRDKRIKIVLIIDESHSGAYSEISKEIKESIISPDLILEVSATPKLLSNEGDFSITSIKHEDVIRDEMIKEEIIINDFEEEDINLSFLIKKAIELRNELKKMYESEGSQANPLVGVQIPNKEKGEAKQSILIEELSKAGITTNNHKLAIWLTGEQINLENISELDGSQEFLIFKQAIATGWDCPRAQIWLKLREESGSEVFEIQTAGRFLRTAEQKYYKNDLLNKAYILTDDLNYKVKKEEMTYFKSLVSCRDEDLYKKPIVLPSKGLLTTTNQIDLQADFYSFFAKNFNLQKIKLNLNIHEKTRLVAQKTKISSNLDNVSEISAQDSAKINYLDEEIQVEYDTFLRNILRKNKVSPFGLDKIKKSLEISLNRQLKIDISNKVFIQRLILDEENYDVIEKEISKVLELYRTEDSVKKEEKTISEWEIPAKIYCNKDTFLKHPYDKISLHKPLYVKNNMSNPEKDLIKMLENNSDMINWWWKNDEHFPESFGITYCVHNQAHEFFPDFLVLDKTGKLWIIETKSLDDSRNLTDNLKEKHKVLKEFINKNSSKKQPIGGGIAVFQKGKCYIYTADELDWNSFMENAQELKFK